MRRNHFASSALTIAACFLSAAASAQAETERAREPAPRASAKHYNLGKQRLAIQGYDPVSYFAAGGSKPRRGDARYTLDHSGVVYRFASKQNLELFRKSPAKFEPAYGGWCAYAMREGDKVEVDAESFLIQDGRLMLFYNGFWGNTRKSWSRGDTGGQAKAADAAWKKISGESAPAPAKKKRKDDGKDKERSERGGGRS